MASMQKLAGLMRRAIEKYDMIQPGDRIAIGISGGKDSMALLMGLHQLRTYIGIPYEIVGLTLDPCFSGVQTDYSPIAALCERLGVEYICKRTEIGQIVFDRRAESQPLQPVRADAGGPACATRRWRRGATRLRWATTSMTPSRPSS